MFSSVALREPGTRPRDTKRGGASRVAEARSPFGHQRCDHRAMRLRRTHQRRCCRNQFSALSGKAGPRNPAIGSAYPPASLINRVATRRALREGHHGQCRAKQGSRTPQVSTTKSRCVDREDARRDGTTQRTRRASDVTCEGFRIGDLEAEWIVPPEAASDRVILYLHGGGYVMGSITTHRATIARIARASKARALALEYRLAPEHQFPAAVEDSVAAYKWLIAQGYKPNKIVIAGDSAGGGLTLAALLSIRDQKLPMAAAGVAISPWADLEGTGDSHQNPRASRSDGGWQRTRRDGEALHRRADPKHPLASPIHADYQRRRPHC